MDEYCVCGAALVNVFQVSNEDLKSEDRKYDWFHKSGSDTPCTEVRPVKSLIPDRKLIQAAAEQMSALINRTRRASGEVERFQSITAELAEDVRELKHSLDHQDTIRQATLVAVWDRLTDAGYLDAAELVNDMIARKS